MRRAKIVATLGPATSSYENIRAIIDAGVNVARMNLSHGTYAVHEEVFRNVRKASDDLGKAVAILVDLQGPKLRIGDAHPRRVDHGQLVVAVGLSVLKLLDLLAPVWLGLIAGWLVYQFVTLQLVVGLFAWRLRNTSSCSI